MEGKGRKSVTEGSESGVFCGSTKRAVWHGRFCTDEISLQRGTCVWEPGVVAAPQRVLCCLLHVIEGRRIV